MDLTAHLHQKYFRVCMDYFYTSVELLEDLVVSGVDACGTVRSNRKNLPNNLLPKNTRLDKYQLRVAQKNELTVYEWLSLYYQIFMTQSALEL